MGVTGASVVISIVVSKIASEKSASIGEIGARMKAVGFASLTSSNVAKAGVMGANVVNVDEFKLLITTAPSLLAKRAFTERVKIAAKIVIVAFIVIIVFRLVRQRYIGMRW